MATFYPFPRLPLELRIQIWDSATEDRVLIVRNGWMDTKGYWSPTCTQVPAVTRACRESRKYCSYRKSFIIDSSPRYIWTNFDCDTIQIRSGLLADRYLPQMGDVRRLIIECWEVHGQALGEVDSFYSRESDNFRHLPKLESVDILVANGQLRYWTTFIEDRYWGRGGCLKENVRIVDVGTGEWIDEKTSGPYQDYLDTNEGENENYTRVVDEYSDEEEDEDDETIGRAEAMKRVMPLPRIDLSYIDITVSRNVQATQGVQLVEQYALKASELQFFCSRFDWFLNTKR